MYLLFNLTCLSILPACMYVSLGCAWCPWKSEGDIGYSGTRVIGGYKPPRGVMRIEPSLLQKQQMLLTVESTLQPQYMHFSRTFLFRFWVLIDWFDYLFCACVSMYVGTQECVGVCRRQRTSTFWCHGLKGHPLFFFFLSIFTGLKLTETNWSPTLGICLSLLP